MPGTRFPRHRPGLAENFTSVDVYYLTCAAALAWPACFYLVIIVAGDVLKRQNFAIFGGVNPFRQVISRHKAPYFFAPNTRMVEIDGFYIQS